MLNKKALSATAGVAAEAAYIEDVFSTYLYTGTGPSSPGRTVDTGLDLLNEGGVVWIKNRGNAYAHRVFDSTRAKNYLATNNTAASAAGLDFVLTSTGFRIPDGDYELNGVDEIYTSWSFKKAAKFFDVVSYTGNGSSSRAITHNLGSTPGCVIVKRTDDVGRWKVWHRSVPTVNGNLNDTSAFDSNVNNMFFQGYISDASSTTFTVSQASTGVQDVNGNGYNYIAYLFAHDAGGFGDAGNKSVISCGSYTGNGSTDGPIIDLGWEPQWLLIKSSVGATSSWSIFDNVRGMNVKGLNDFQLQANTDVAESTGGSHIGVLENGFQLTSTSVAFNASGVDFVYIAIRRGPMKTPTDATKVFTPTVYTGTNVDNRLINTTIAPDFVMIRLRTSSAIPGMYTGSRLTGQEFMTTGETTAASTDADSFDEQSFSGTSFGNAFSSMSGVWVGNDVTRQFNANTTSNNHIIYAFKRAPGFMDVVCYKGTGSTRTVTHNLGVAPELILIKKRDGAQSWGVYAQPIGNTKFLLLNASNGEGTDSGYWNNTSPTSSVFTVNTSVMVNESNLNYIAILFASCPGVSKVGTYTGTGATLNLDFGFTAGARYFLTKQTDSAGDWFVVDTARGIVSGGDPWFALNLTSAESSANNLYSYYASGITLTDSAGSTTRTNINGATYIYLAIA